MGVWAMDILNKSSTVYKHIPPSIEDFHLTGALTPSHGESYFYVALQVSTRCFHFKNLTRFYDRGINGLYLRISQGEELNKRNSMKSTTLIVNFVIILIYLCICALADNLTDQLSTLAFILQDTKGGVNLNSTPTSLSDFTRNSLKHAYSYNRCTKRIFTPLCQLSTLSICFFAILKLFSIVI